MKTVTLDRTERRKLQKDTGALAETLAARAYEYNKSLASDFDAARKSGAVLEVKSTLSRLQPGQRGRFRIFKPQHERLVRQDRDGSANYVFVLFDLSSSPVARMIRKNPADVGYQIAGRGGFNQSGHSAGKQIKMPYSTFFDV